MNSNSNQQIAAANTYVKKRNSKLKSYVFKDNFQLSILALPCFLLIFIFHYLPMIGVVIAFKDFNANLGILKSPWVGLDNFIFFFTSQDAWRVLRNTVLYGVDFQVTGMLTALALAILLYGVRSKMAIKYYQTTMILPNFLSMVLVAYITYALLNPTAGVLNTIVRLFGGKGISWYSEPKYWPWILTTVNIWKHMGVNTIIYYAALIGIDESLFEAAKIDGATKWQEIKYIIIPELTSIICILLILGIGNLISGDMGLFYQIPMNIGVLYPTTDIINTYVFRGLQQATNMGMTSAVGLFQSVISLILVVGSNMIIKRINPDNSLF